MAEKTFEFSEEEKKCYRGTRAKIKSSSRPLLAEERNLKQNFVNRTQDLTPD